MKLATQDQYELKMNMTCFSWQKNIQSKGIDV